MSSIYEESKKSLESLDFELVRCHTIAMMNSKRNTGKAICCYGCCGSRPSHRTVRARERRAWRAEMEDEEWRWVDTTD